MTLHDCNKIWLVYKVRQRRQFWPTSTIFNKKFGLSVLDADRLSIPINMFGP